MRGRAYGSDEAENWPQRKTGRKRGRKKRSHKERKKERERVSKKERGKVN